MGPSQAIQAIAWHLHHVDPRFTIEAYCNSRGFRPSSTATYTHAVRRFEAWLALTGRQIGSEAGDSLHDYRRYLADECRLASSTCDTYIRSVTYYLRWLAQSGFLPDEPSYVIPSRQKHWGSPSTITTEQFRSVLDHALDDRMWCLCATLALTGIKSVDILERNVSDLATSDTGSLLHLPRSQGRLPYTELHPQLASRLHAYVAGAPPLRPLFTTRSGARLSRGGAAGVIETAGRRARLPLRLTSSHLYYFLPWHSIDRGFSYDSVLRAIGVVQPNQTSRWLQILSTSRGTHAGVRLGNVALSDAESPEYVLNQLVSLRQDTTLPEPFTVMAVGAVYERHLRRLCMVEHLDVPEDPKRGSIAKYTALLHEAGSITLSQRQESEQLGEWRNQSAHGNFDAIVEGTAARSLDLLRLLFDRCPVDAL